MIKRSKGEKAKVCVCAGDGKVKCKDSGCIRLTKMQLVSME